MAKYDKQTAIDFIKALEESKVVIKNSHKRKEVVDNITELINLSEEDVKGMPITVTNLHHEFTDWIETYGKVV